MPRATLTKEDAEVHDTMATPLGSSPQPRSLAGEDVVLPTETVTAPILGQARKLAGLWVTSDNGQAAYLDWMAFCEDWARHRLRQAYYEVHDEAWWERQSKLF